MATQKKSTFDTLYALNVNGKTEKKGSLTYLSWAAAWAEAKTLFPDINYTIYENVDTEGRVLNYFSDGSTSYVKVGVTIDGLEHINYLPVMDYRNKSIGMDKLTSFDVNTAIQRCLTKALGMHGLGLYIYQGEDLPHVEVVDAKTAQTKRTTPKAAKGKDISIDADNWKKVLTWAKQNKDNSALVFAGLEKKGVTLTPYMEGEINKILS